MSCNSSNAYVLGREVCMKALQKLNEDVICCMEKESGVLGAWEFGSGMYHTRDEYSDIDIVFLVSETDYFRVDGKLREILDRVCDNILIFWAEGFNGESIRNYDCILERDGKLLSYDIFLLNHARIDDNMCILHYADLKEENIYFDRDGAVAELLGKVLERKTWQDDLLRLIETYWLHINMTIKYFLRKDYFKLEGVLRILMDTHTSLLLTAYDKITWGGTANKCHYLPEEKQSHLKKYFCDEDFYKVKENLWQEMCWFREDVQELNQEEVCRISTRISEKIINEWQRM